jgi:hypothetical protein
MKKIAAMLTALGVFSLAFVGQAQTTVNGKVNGTVLSAQKPVDAASVSLLRAKDSVVVKLAVSDKTGTFELENIRQGKYLVSVQAAGHARFYSEVFDISTVNANYTIKNIALKAASKELAGVTVSSSKPLIEQKIDRTIVNVEASVTNTGSTAMDVLEKSPGISVDKDGNISLKGKQGVQVFIDGRPTYLSGQDLANMLKNMQSSQLDQLEIMTNPPAKYDAAGNSGIINIKTKKNKQFGYNGSVTAGYGQGVYPRTNESVNMNYRNGSINLFGNISYAYNENYQVLTIQRKFYDAVTKNLSSNFNQVNNLHNSSQNLNSKIGMDYFASKKTTFGIVLTGNSNPNDFSSRGNINIADPNQVLLSQTRAFSDNKESWKNFSSNFNMRHTIDTTGSEITADLDYIRYNSSVSQNVTNSYFDPSGAVLAGSRPDTLLGNLPQLIDIYSAKVDYIKPLKKGAKFEAGLKTSFVKTDNNAWYDSLINNKLVHDFGRSNHFIYKENINAAYANLSGNISKKLSGQLGLRLEQTHAEGNQVTSAITFTRDYIQLFPTVYLQYQANTKNSFVINYGKRIGRPNYADLNPFVTFLDRYTFQQGNPNLLPQFSHNIELTHTYNGFLTTTLNYTKTTDIIQDVFEQNTALNQTYIKKSNIANQRQYGLSVNAFVNVTKWWSNNFYANVFNNQFQGIVNGEAVNINASTAMFNATEQFKFKNGWGAEASGFYRTPSIEGILKVYGFGAMNLGMSKQLLKNKASLKLSIKDVLWTQKFKAESELNNVNAQFQQYRDSRVVNISFTYRFSKGKVSNTQQKRGGASEEASRVKGADN